MPRNDHRQNGVVGAARLELVLLCAIIALVAAVLAVFAWTRPTTASSIVGYHQVGSLTYSAPVSPTSVYGPSGVQTGQPVYQRLVPTLQLSYKYEFQSSAPTSLQGTEQLVAKLTSGEALSRTFPLQAPTPFKGNSFTATGVLHLATLQTALATFNQVNGGGASSYSVSISPHVTVKGTVASRLVKTHFDPALKFTYTGSEFAPVAVAASGGPASATVNSRVGKPIVSTVSNSVEVPGAINATLIGGVGVLDARIASLAILALALAAGGYLGWPLLREATSDDERVRIATKFSSTLVEVASLPRSPGSVVEVASFAGLERVGRQLECPLLHLPTDSGDEYAVVDNGTVYLYRAGGHSAPRLGRVVSASGDSPRHASMGRGSATKRARSS